VPSTFSGKGRFLPQIVLRFSEEAEYLPLMITQKSTQGSKDLNIKPKPYEFSKDHE
jgi:hypothetical protein